MSFDTTAAARLISEFSEAANWKRLWREGKKVESIKELRGQTGLGLKESKDICEYYGQHFAGAVNVGSATNGVETTTVTLPDGLGRLVVINNGTYASIIHVKEVAMGINIPQDKLLAEVAKTAARIALASND
jgi:Ribosomal protein L7/L12